MSNMKIEALIAVANRELKHEIAEGTAAVLGEALDQMKVRIIRLEHRIAVLEAGTPLNING